MAHFNSPILAQEHLGLLRLENLCYEFQKTNKAPHIPLTPLVVKCILANPSNNINSVLDLIEAKSVNYSLLHNWNGRENARNSIHIVLNNWTSNVRLSQPHQNELALGH